MGLVNGRCDSRFKELRDVLEANVASGEEMGASIAIDLDGEAVVDLWGGWRDEAHVPAVGTGHDRQRVVDDQDRSPAWRC